jgi:putative SOS response-associated peptidase YedK
MCAHYEAVRQWEAYEKHFGIQRPLDSVQLPLHVFPTALAPLIRRPAELDSGDEAVPAREVVLGHFGLLPGFAKDTKYGLRTYNARSETVDQLASFKHAWSKRRHCIIACEAIYEPDWRTGKHIATRITRHDGAPMGVAGLWSPWKDPVTGQWHSSFTMLTINADTHPIFKELHRPDLKRPPEKQDKRMVVILNDDAYDAWLDAPVERSKEFLVQYPAGQLLAVGMPIAAKPSKTAAIDEE